MREKKIIRKILFGIILSFLTFCRGLPDCDMVQAATGVTLTLQGLEVGDLVEIYRIASYKEDSDSYAWESTVADWIQNKSEGNAYKGLKPEQLSQMTRASAKEFCQTLIVGLKNESKGIANLDGYTFPVSEEKEQYQVENVSPGYYIVLPKGTDRIYELKWLEIAPGSDSQVSYDADEGDYQMPTVTATVENKTTDRGKIRDGTFVIEGDEVEINAVISIPAYPDMYATGKRILNITVIVPQGLDYKEDTLNLSLTDESAYSVGTYEKATTYETAGGDILFFGTPQGYYYELNGRLLVSSGTATEAVAKYNQTYETGYTLKEQDSASSGQMETTEESEAMEGTENAEAVMVLTAEDDSAELTACTARTVFVIALDTEQSMDEVTLGYQAVKNRAASNTGAYDNMIALSYSASPLDTNLMYSAISQAAVSAYSITIVSCEGSGESINMTAEEKLEKSPRFSGVVFTLYRLNKTYDGDAITGTEAVETAADGTETDSAETDSTETAAAGGNEPLQMIYDADADKTYEYAYVTTLTTNSQGTASIGGLEADEYLVEQTIYPSGYTLSDSSLRISKAAWTDETIMEGTDNLLVIWLEYETRYLPGTGKQGITAFAFLGSLISATALLMLFRQYYPYGLPEIFQKRKKS